MRFFKNFIFFHQLLVIWILIFPGFLFSQIVEEEPREKIFQQEMNGYIYSKANKEFICDLNSFNIRNSTPGAYYNADSTRKVCHDENIEMVLKISYIPELFGKKVLNYCLIEKAEKNIFLNKNTLDTFEFRITNKYYPFERKYLVKIEWLDKLHIKLHYLSGCIWPAQAYTFIDEFLPPIDEIPVDYRHEMRARIVIKSRLFVFNATEPVWDSLDIFKDSPFLSFRLAKCDLTEGKSCEVRYYKYDENQFHRDDFHLIYYTLTPPNKIKSSNEKFVYEVKRTFNYALDSYYFIPQYRPLPPEELQELIAKGKFYPYFHDN